LQPWWVLDLGSLDWVFDLVKWWAINRCAPTFFAALALGVVGVAASRRSRWP
jgi:hypothetical protein